MSSREPDFVSRWKLPKVFAHPPRPNLVAARQVGYASNHQDTEKGLTALGVALTPLPGAIHAAICLAMPTARFRRTLLDSYVSALTEAAREIAAAFSLGTSTLTESR